MSNLTTSSQKHPIEAFSGSLLAMNRRIATINDDANIKIVVLACSGMSARRASKLTKLFGNSQIIHRYLSGEINSDFYESIFNANLPKTLPTPTLLIEAREIAAEKKKILDSGDFLTAKQIRAMANLVSLKASIFQKQWIREKKIFSILCNGEEYFPIYALQPDKKFLPNPTVAKVLQILGADKGGLKYAVWFATGTKVLGGLSPKEVLLKDPASVISVARQEIRHS